MESVLIRVGDERGRKVLSAPERVRIVRERFLGAMWDRRDRGRVQGNAYMVPGISYFGDRYFGTDVTSERRRLVRSRLIDSGVTVLAPMIWGSTYLVTTELLPPDRPLLAAVVRALPAGLILLAVGRVVPKGVWVWRALLLGTLNIGAFFVFLFVAAYRLPGGVAALIGSFQPMIVLVLAALLLSDRIKLIQVAACVLGALGVALLVLRPTAELDMIGVVAALAGAVSMAAGIVLTKRWQRPAGVGLLQFTGWQLTAGGLVLVPVTLIAEGLPADLTGTNITGYLYLIVLGSLVGYSVWFRGIERLPALAVSFLGFASPIVATILGYVFLGQALTGAQLVGALVIIGAVALVQPRRRRPPVEPGATAVAERAAPT